jgi:hypothetical protein
MIRESHSTANDLDGGAFVRTKPHLGILAPWNFGILELCNLGVYEFVYFGRILTLFFCSQITDEHLRRVLADGGPDGGEPHSHALQGKLPFSFSDPGCFSRIQGLFHPGSRILGMFFFLLC